MTNLAGRTFAAPDDGINSYLFSRQEVFYLFAYRFDDAGKLVTGYMRQVGTGVKHPFEQVLVGSADAGIFNFDQYIVIL